MSGGAYFSALNTKLDAVKGRLLSPQDYENLMSKKSVVEIARYLAENTHYRDVFEGVNIDGVHRAELARILKGKSVLLLESILNFLDGVYKDYCRALFMRYEIEDIKLILRSLGTHRNLRRIDELLLHSERQESVSFAKLLGSENLDEFLAVLQGSRYENAFRNLTQEDLSIREFHAEMNLDSDYFKTILKKVRRMDRENRELLEEAIGINIDLINLQWIYRAKTYYRLMPEEILNYTLSGGRSYYFSAMKSAVYAEDFGETMKATVPASYLPLTDGADIYMERRIYQYLYEMFQKLERKGSKNMGKMASITHFLEYEIRDIITITEATRYELDTETMKNFLIRSFG